MAKKWTVEYGPFSDEIISLVAKSMGHGSMYVTEESEADFVTRRMQEHNTELLSSAKIAKEKQQFLDQANAVEEAVKADVASLIKITVETMEE